MVICLTTAVWNENNLTQARSVIEELLSNYQNYVSIASSIRFLSFFSLYSAFFDFLFCVCVLMSLL